MNNKLQPVRGTRDYLAEDSLKFQQIVEAAKACAQKYNFESLITPIFEETAVFSRTLGEESDVVNKEMYSFKTRSDEDVTLRPEFTAGVVRSFISNGLQQNLPCKFFSYGPVFRYERPQKGRQRQFHQINFEYFGNATPPADVEVILLASDILDELGVNNVEININTLGDKESRKTYTDALVAYLSKYETELSEDSQRRLKTNPLRILDSKDEKDKEIIKDAPKLSDSLNGESKEFFDKVINLLKKHCKLPVKINDRIVRGLDYYNHTVFEFLDISGDLGAQNTILAGGRYDGLVKMMGGPETPAVGFAAGIERLMLLPLKQSQQNWLIAIISDDNEKSLQAAQLLRQQNLNCEIIYSGNFRKKIAKADKSNASHILFVFEDGYELKDMLSGEQKKISLNKISNIITG
jgi:histidyl-tRNA synthetase